MSKGFKGFRPTETIVDDALQAALKRIGAASRYIYWTGGTYRGRSQSLRYNALRCVDKVGVPIPFTTWLQKVARVAGDTVGYSPDRAVDGLYLHAGAKPAVYIELMKDGKGNFVAVRDSLMADPAKFPKGIRKGDVIVPFKMKAAGKQQPKGKGAQATQVPAAQAPAPEQPQA